MRHLSYSSEHIEGIDHGTVRREDECLDPGYGRGAKPFQRCRRTWKQKGRQHILAIRIQRKNCPAWTEKDEYEHQN